MCLYRSWTSVGFAFLGYHILLDVPVKELIWLIATMVPVTGCILTFPVLLKLDGCGCCVWGVTGVMPRKDSGRKARGSFWCYFFLSFRERGARARVVVCAFVGMPFCGVGILTRWVGLVTLRKRTVLSMLP